MKQIIEKLKILPTEKIKVLIAASLLVLDLFNIFYIKHIILNDPRMLRNVRMAMTMGQFNQNLPTEYLQEIDSLLFQSIWIMLVVFIMNNMFFYYLYLKSKKSGIQYVKVLAYSGAGLSLLNIFSPGTSSYLWIFGLILQLTLYACVSWIIKTRSDITPMAKAKSQARQS